MSTVKMLYAAKIYKVKATTRNRLRHRPLLVLEALRYFGLEVTPDKPVHAGFQPNLPVHGGILRQQLTNVDDDVADRSRTAVEHDLSLVACDADEPGRLVLLDGVRPLPRPEERGQFAADRYRLVAERSLQHRLHLSK